MFRTQWLEYRQRFCFAPEHKITYWAAKKIRDLFCNGRADTNPSTKLLVGRFKTSSNIDRVAIGGVVEEALAAKIADNRRPSMDANARHAERDPPFKTVFAECFSVLV